MIEDLNKVLHSLFQAQMTGLMAGTPPSVSNDQIRFQPPDADLVSHVSGLGTRPALNAYLVDLRENRKLRSNQRNHTTQDGLCVEEAVPDRMDCHYIISAWGTESDFDERTRTEHELLYEVSAVLMRNAPLSPARILPKPELVAIDPLIQEGELPTQVLPADGFAKLAEFWGTMGTGHRWKPAVYLIVTLPVARRTKTTSPMVTTKITEYRLIGSTQPGEILIQFGGQVLDARQPQLNPVTDAWVELATSTGTRLRTTRTDQLGRFVFGELSEGPYRLRARATGLGETTRAIDVPSPTGEYDLRFT